MSCWCGVVPLLYIISSKMLYYTSKGVLLLLLETKIRYAETRDKFSLYIVKLFQLGYLTLNSSAEEPAFKGRECFCLVYF
jgi:uncharacterized membrane protein